MHVLPPKSSGGFFFVHFEITMTNIFDRPPLELKKITHSRLIHLLRERLNQHYMPSATGTVTVNSKPYYAEERDPAHPSFPKVPGRTSKGWRGGSSTYAFTGEAEYLPGGKLDKTIFANLVVDDFQILVNLSTLATLVRTIKNERTFTQDPGFWSDPEPTSPWYDWPQDDARGLPLNPFALAECIDQAL
jgi:hypothetical protein